MLFRHSASHRNMEDCVSKTNISMSFPSINNWHLFSPDHYPFIHCPCLLDHLPFPGQCPPCPDSLMSVFTLTLTLPMTTALSQPVILMKTNL